MAEADVTQVAQALNVSPRYVQKLVGLGMPQIARGRYELGRCMAWYIRHLQNAIQRRSIADGDGVTSLTAQRVLIATGNAEAIARENARKRGELIESRIVFAMLPQIPVTMIQGHITVANRLASELASIGEPQRIKERLLEELGSVGEQCAQLVRQLAATSGAIAEERAAVHAEAAKNAGPVGGRQADSAEGISGAGTVPESPDAVHDAGGADGDEWEVPQDSGGDGSADWEDGGTPEHSGASSGREPGADPLRRSDTLDGGEAHRAALREDGQGGAYALGSTRAREGIE